MANTWVRTRQAGKAQRGWRAGARTQPHLGPADLPGFVQEGAVIELRPCDLARETIGCYRRPRIRRSVLCYPILLHGPPRHSHLILSMHRNALNFMRKIF